MGPIERIEKGSAELQRVIDGIKADDMGLPTPCSEYNVKQLLNHLFQGQHMLLTAARTGKAEQAGDDLVSDDPSGQFKQLRSDLIAAFDEETLGKTLEMPFGAMPGAMMAGIAFMEHVTHAWDLAKATGQGPIDEALAAECLEASQPMGPMLRMPGVCAAEVEVPADAPVQDRMAAFLGRQP